MEISEEMIQQAIDTGIVSIVFDEGIYSGVSCMVRKGNKEKQFWFAGSAGDDAESLNDFYKNYCDKDEMPVMLYECIGTPELAKENGIPWEDWKFYFSVISAVNQNV